MNLKSLFLLLNILLFTIPLIANDKIVGVWLTQDTNSKIEIYKNDDGSYDGNIIWLRRPSQNGKPKFDKNNPEENLRSRQIIGLKILDGFKYDAAEKEWNNGTIYDPNTGSTYKCYMWFDNNGQTLNVKGYIGLSLIGRKVEWTRVH